MESNYFDLFPDMEIEKNMQIDKLNSLHSCSDNASLMLSNFQDIPSWSDIYEEEINILSLISDSQKKIDGVFFTPDTLVKIAINKFQISENDRYFDPSCGTGNLLLEIIASLLLKDSLEETLIFWNSRIFGLDINEDFINITKKKIIRYALDQGCKTSNQVSINLLMSLLSNIRKGNFIEEYKSYIGIIDHVIMNPPFCSVLTPDSVPWTSGKSNAAALFLYFSSEIVAAKGKLIGILPDVIRSGARYSKLRDYLHSRLNVQIEPYGEFQKNVQIDVFLLEGTRINGKQDPTKLITSLPLKPVKILESDFIVSVGPVVPHRDPEIGDEAPYIHAKTLIPWAEIECISERIMHQGRKISSPFVAIRRTSSPKDKHRVIGTIINCTEPVLVENHIIVAQPRQGGLKSCRELLKHLSTVAISEYVDTQIRCRHLTVGVVKSIPLE